WAKDGVKPVFFVEWGLPHIASWSSYRGPHFIWRTPAYQSLWASEFIAPYLGQEAYNLNGMMRDAVRREERLFAEGKEFVWSNLSAIWRGDDKSYRDVQARFASENWRAHRTWGLSAMLPWDQQGFWVRTKRLSTVNNPDAFKNLKRPGIVPDKINPGSQYIYDRTDDGWVATNLGATMKRWNRPVIAYVGGNGKNWNERSHIFTKGEVFEKQLISVNDSREALNAKWEWSVKASGANEKLISGSADVSVEAGEPSFFAINVDTSKLDPGAYRIVALFAVGTAEEQSDEFSFTVIPPVDKPELKSRIALFDPAEKSKALLDNLGVAYKEVNADSDMSGFDLLILGRESVSSNGAIPSIAGVRNGLRVLVFEQSADVLEKRLGFRINVHGMRTAYIRSAGNPVFSGIDESMLRDWRGAATMTAPYLENLPEVEASNPKWFWAGIENTRVWRCGNTGNVASVLIEKPSVGNWKALADCGFDLQYSPLLEYREGKGKVVFCQLDVSSRTESEPAVQRIVANLLVVLDKPALVAVRPVVSRGGAEIKSLLESLGVIAADFDGSAGAERCLIVAGPEEKDGAALRKLAESGAHVLALGLGENTLKALLPGEEIGTVKAIPSYVAKFDSPWVDGISNAELHCRSELSLPGFMKTGESSNEFFKVVETGKGVIIVSQIAPWMLDYKKKMYLRTSYRRNLYMVGQLLRNLGAPANSPLLGMLQKPGEQNLYRLASIWKGKVDKNGVGRNEKWFAPEVDDVAWEDMHVPGSFDQESKGLDESYDGLYWYRLRFNVPADFSKDTATLYIGAVDDESWIWLNGEFLGEVSKVTRPKDYYRFPRVYELPADLLKRDGENVISVLVNDTYLSGGIKGTPVLKAGKSAWLRSYYVQTPESIDDPYRYYRW
ncbi:MAG: beta galactosidase jelly roll domain-containing protein, partial [Planctomycetes bacterium]|nr:beta galactosidase jelly roll domain-containing protein [Planctomycetota bacterium]